MGRRERDPGGRSAGSVPNAQRGQALVEFALVAPVMLLLLLVAVDFGRVLFSFIAVNNAAREGAQYAAEHAMDMDTPLDVDAYNAEVIAAAVGEVNVQGQGGEGVMTVSNPSCTLASSGAPMSCDIAATVTAGIGNHVMVSVTQPFSFMTPFIGDRFLGGTARHQRERDRSGPECG